MPKLIAEKTEQLLCRVSPEEKSSLFEPCKKADVKLSDLVRLSLPILGRALTVHASAVKKKLDAAKLSGEKVSINIFPNAKELEKELNKAVYDKLVQKYKK